MHTGTEKNPNDSSADLQMNKDHGVQSSAGKKPMLLRVVILAFSPSVEIFRQACVAALGVLSQVSRPCEIVVFTDRSEDFSWLKPAIRVETVSDAELVSWKGGQNHLFRGKFCALKRAADLGPAHLLYLDADVLVRRQLDELVCLLDQGACLMHVKEKALAERKTSNRKPLLHKTLGRTFAGISIAKSTVMYNAGVVGIPAAKTALIDQALAVNDAMLSAGINHWLVEQLSWSATLGATERLLEANPWILHYWGNKPAFQKAIDSFLAGALMQGWSPAQAARALLNFRFDIPLRVKKRWWHDPVLKILHIPIRN